MAKKPVKKIEIKEPIYTDIIHKEIDGIMYDVYLNGKKEVKREVSKE